MDSQQIGENSPFSLSTIFRRPTAPLSFHISETKQNKKKTISNAVMYTMMGHWYKINEKCRFLKNRIRLFLFYFLSFFFLFLEFSVFNCGNIWILCWIFPYRLHRLPHDEKSPVIFNMKYDVHVFNGLDIENLFIGIEKEFSFVFKMNLIDDFLLSFIPFFFFFLFLFER